MKTKSFQKYLEKKLTKQEIINIKTQAQREVMAIDQKSKNKIIPAQLDWLF